MPFYRSSDVVSAYKGTTNKKAYISETLFEQLSKVSGRPEKDDIFLTGGGSIGIPYKVPDNRSLYTKDADLLWVKNSINFDSQFLYTFFTTPLFRRYVSSISHVGTIAHYTIEQVKSTPVFMPDINEQKKIGEFLGSLTDTIALHQNKLIQLQGMKKAFLQQMFPGNSENVPTLRFANFESVWEQRKLEEDIKLIGGATPFKGNNEYWNGDIVWLSSQEIKEKYVEKGTYTITWKAIEDNTTKLVKAGTPLIVTRSGILNRLFPISLPTRDVAINQDIKALIYNFENIDTNFLFAQLQELTDFILRTVVKTGTTVQSINIPDFVKMELSYPQLYEQKQIGFFFKQFDDVIALHQGKLIQLQSLKKAFLQQMFPSNTENIPKLRFADFDSVWEQCKLGDIGETFTGLSGKTKDDFGHGEASFVTYINVFKNYIADSKLIENIEIDNKQIKVQYGDILFTTSSETPEEVGMSSIWLDKIDNVYLNSFCFGYRLNIDFNPLFWAFMLRSPMIRSQFVLLAQGISRYNISKKKTMDIQAPTPALNEQKIIGQFLTNLDTLSKSQEKKLNLLQNLKKAYLQKMFI